MVYVLKEDVPFIYSSTVNHWVLTVICGIKWPTVVVDAKWRSKLYISLLYLSKDMFVAQTADNGNMA